MAAPKLTAAPDKSIAYPVTVDGKAYQQQVFTVRSETWVFDYDVAVAFSDPATGTRIVDMDNRDITAVTTEGTGEGYVGQFKVLYPAESIQGESGNVQLSLKASVSHYAAMYAVCAEKDKYGQLQNYICDTDNNAQLDAAAISSYRGDAENPDAPQDETALKIIKLEEGTQLWKGRSSPSMTRRAGRWAPSPPAPTAPSPSPSPWKATTPSPRRYPRSSTCSLMSAPSMWMQSTTRSPP